MAMKVFLGLLHTRSVSSVRTLNTWGSFSQRSYCTAQKVVKYSPEKLAMTESTMTELECEIHNSKMPTYEQVKNSPELQAELEKMYEDYATDPDFHQITRESMALARWSLGKEEC